MVPRDSIPSLAGTGIFYILGCGYMQLTGAHAVCEALLREGVEVMFGHPGGAALPFYDALYHYPQIRHILVRHEQAAAHAAEGYARATGRLGV